MLSKVSKLTNSIKKRVSRLHLRAKQQMKKIFEPVYYLPFDEKEVELLDVFTGNEEKYKNFLNKLNVDNIEYYKYYKNFDLLLLSKLAIYSLLLANEAYLNYTKIMSKVNQKLQTVWELSKIEIKGSTTSLISIDQMIDEINFLFINKSFNKNEIPELLKTSNQFIFKSDSKELINKFDSGELIPLLENFKNIINYYNKIFLWLNLNENNLVWPNFGPAIKYVLDKSEVLALNLVKLRNILYKFLKENFVPPTEMEDQNKFERFRGIGIWTESVFIWLKKYNSFWKDNISDLHNIYKVLKISYYLDKLNLNIDKFFETINQKKYGNYIKFFDSLFSWENTALKEYILKNASNDEIVDLIVLLEKNSKLIQKFSLLKSLEIKDILKLLTLGLPKKDLLNFITIKDFNKLLNIEDLLEKINELWISKIKYILYTFDNGLEILQLPTRLIKLVYNNEKVLEDIDLSKVDPGELEKLIEDKKLYSQKEYLKTVLPKYLSDEVESIKSFDEIESIKNKYEEYIELFSKFPILKKIFDALYDKKPKKLKNKQIFEVVNCIKDNYLLSDLDFILTLLSHSNIKITEEFYKNFEEIISNLIKKKSFISLKNIKTTITLSDLYKSVNDLDIENKVRNIFSDTQYEFILYHKNTDKFAYLVQIWELLGKDILSKLSDDNFLNLITFENKKLILIREFIEIVKVNFKIGLSSGFVNIVLNDFDSKQNIIEDFIAEYKDFTIDIEESLFFSLLYEIFYNSEQIDLLKKIVFLPEESIEEGQENNLNTWKWLNKLSWWSGKQLLAQLQRLWFTIKRVNGKIQWKWDHILLYREKDNKYFLVPMHKTIKASTLKDTLKRAGILEEFLESLD